MSPSIILLGMLLQVTLMSFIIKMFREVLVYFEENPLGREHRRYLFLAEQWKWIKE